MQNTPPGSAALALHARVEGLAPADLERGLVQEKTLLLVWSVRGSPYVVPTRDAAVFTVGALPSDEASLRVALAGAAKPLAEAGVPLGDALRSTAAAMREALDGRALSKGELSTQVTRRVPAEMAPWCRACQVHHVSESVFRAVGLLGEVCFAGGMTESPSLVRSDQWLGRPLSAPDGEIARAELARRYLHCYGPSTPRHFGQWVQLAPEDASRAFSLVEQELVQVDAAGTKAWLLVSDTTALQSPPPAAGARLLPPHDPYVQMQDRATLVPDKALHRQVWRVIGNPGVVLLDGEIAGTWRPQKQGKRLRLSVELFGPVSAAGRSAIEAEAVGLAPYRGCQATEVVFAE